MDEKVRKKGFINWDEFARQVQVLYETVFDKCSDQTWCTGYRTAIRDVGNIIKLNKNNLSVNGYEALVIDITNDIKEKAK